MPKLHGNAETSHADTAPMTSYFVFVGLYCDVACSKRFDYTVFVLVYGTRMPYAGGDVTGFLHHFMKAACQRRKFLLMVKIFCWVV